MLRASLSETSGWSSASDAQLLEYNLLTDILLSTTNMKVDTFACNDEQCCNADHYSDIDSLLLNSMRRQEVVMWGGEIVANHITV